MRYNSNALPPEVVAKLPPDERARYAPGAVLPAEVEAACDWRLEIPIQDDIATWFDLHEVAFCRPRPDKKSTIRKGWPDFTLAVNGIAVGFEVKSATGTLSDDQIKCHAAMRKDGWQIATVRSLNEVKAELEILRTTGKVSGKRVS